MAAIMTVIRVAEAVDRNSKIRSPGRFTPLLELVVATSSCPLLETRSAEVAFASVCSGAVVRLLSAMRLLILFSVKNGKYRYIPAPPKRESCAAVGAGGIKLLQL